VSRRSVASSKTASTGVRIYLIAADASHVPHAHSAAASLGAIITERDKLGKSVLFFGCRHEAQDFLYADELRQAEAEGYLTHLVTAFSRDQAHKVYVQHRIKEHQQFIWEVMENNGLIYVCGYASSLSIYLSISLSVLTRHAACRDAKAMAKDVYETLRMIVVELGGRTPEQAKQYLTTLQTSNRYLQDIWQ